MDQKLWLFLFFVSNFFGLDNFLVVCFVFFQIRPLTNMIDPNRWFQCLLLVLIFKISTRWASNSFWLLRYDCLKLVLVQSWFKNFLVLPVLWYLFLSLYLSDNIKQEFLYYLLFLLFAVLCLVSCQCLWLKSYGSF